jgi:hypothetical protein
MSMQTSPTDTQAFGTLGAASKLPAALPPINVAAIRAARRLGGHLQLRRLKRWP